MSISYRFWMLMLSIVLLACIPSAEWITKLDLLLLDKQFQWLRDAKIRPVNPDVIVVGIDDASLATFSKIPLTLWHPLLGQFFQAMKIGEPKVVGLDFAFPTDSYDKFLKRDYDRPLLLGVRALKKSPTELILGRTINASGRVRPIARKILLIAGGDRKTGYVLYERDVDQGVRHYQPILTKDDKQLHTLVGRMGEALHMGGKSGIINYSIGSQIPYIPFHKVLQLYEDKQFATIRDFFKDQYVLLGSVLRFEDRHDFPVKLAAWEPNGKYLPGVLFHAQAFRSVAEDKLVQTLDEKWRFVLIAMTLGFWFLAARPIFSGVLLLVFIGTLFVVSYFLLAQDVWFPVVGIIVAGMLSYFIHTAIEAKIESQERKRLKKMFGYYVSPQVMEKIMQGDFEQGLGGKRQELCVLFSDIRNFTRRSESLAPEEVIHLLNRYFSEMTQSIHTYNGTLDKFIGDGIMAFFGAPKKLDDFCYDAFLAAKDMLKRLKQLNEKLLSEGIEPIQIGIGLHFGEAVVGHVGSEERHEYTAIGDMVNLASRLEGLTKGSEYALICSQEFKDKLAGKVTFIAVGTQKIKGHSDVLVYGWKYED